jgi:hypothetical protein
VSLVGNAGAHGLAAGGVLVDGLAAGLVLTMPWWAAAAVGATPPVIFAAVVHLLAMADDGPAGEHPGEADGPADGWESDRESPPDRWAIAPPAGVGPSPASVLVAAGQTAGQGDDADLVELVRAWAADEGSAGHGRPRGVVRGRRLSPGISSTASVIRPVTLPQSWETQRRGVRSRSERRKHPGSRTSPALSTMPVTAASATISPWSSTAAPGSPVRVAVGPGGASMAAAALNSRPAGRRVLLVMAPSVTGRGRLGWVARRGSAE